MRLSSPNEITTAHAPDASILRLGDTLAVRSVDEDDELRAAAFAFRLSSR
jgi:hypothetical protein